MVTLNYTMRELPIEDKTETSKENIQMKGHQTKIESNG